MSKEILQSQNTEKQTKGSDSVLLKAATAGTLLLAVGGVISEANGQTASSVDVNPKFHNTPATAEEIPDRLNSGDTYTINLLHGDEAYIKINDADDPNTVSVYLDGNGTPRTVTGNITKIDKGDFGTGLISYTKNGATKTISLRIHGKNSLTINNEFKEIGWEGVNGEGVNVSAGSNMISYKWKDINDNSFPIVGSSTDSVRVFQSGVFVSRTNDGSGLTEGYSNDTISILKRPTINQTAKQIEFATTGVGVTYNIYKINTDKTETLVNSFVGDGNSHNITGLENLTSYRVAAKRTTDPYEVEDKSLAPLETSFTTFIDNPEETPKNNFIVYNNQIIRNTEERDLDYKIFGINGQFVSSGFVGYKMSATINNPGAYVVITEKGGKIISKGKAIIK